jgi:large subunit ribosomal protein L17
MRHAMRGRKLGRTASHRIALFRNQLAALVDKERIVTTLPKAKELRPIAERVITQTKRGTVHARRMAGRWLADRDLLKKLFDDIGPRMSERPGGYLRIVKLGHRKGDGAEMAILELVDFKPTVAPAPEEPKGKKAKEGEEGGEETKAEKKAKAKKAQPKGEKMQRGKSEKRVRTDAHAKGAAKVKTPRKAGGE